MATEVPRGSSYPATHAPLAVGIPSDSRRSLWTLLLVGLVLLPAPFLTPSGRGSTSPTASSVIPAGHLAASAALSRGGGLTGYFTENRGQVRNKEVQYYVTTGDLRVGMVPSGLLVEKLAAGPDDPAGRYPVRSDADLDGTDGEPPRIGSLFRIAFEGSNRVAPQGRDGLPFRTNYLQGHDPAAWHAGIASFRDVVYADLYVGIDLLYHADAAGLKYEFLVRPGADPGRIRWSYTGAAGLQIRDGALIIRTDAGEIRDAPPIAYQAGRGVPCRYVLEGSSVGLACDAWDSAQALTIDPLLYSTFLGGTVDSRGIAIAVDASGDAYITGHTQSPNFPTTPGAFRTAYAGRAAAFVGKLSLVLAPTIRITSPASGAVATTSVTVTGTASHATIVRLRVGSAPWTNATGVSSWTATLDLSAFPTGSLVIQAVAYNGTLASAPDSVTIQKASTSPTMDRCTVRPAIVAIAVGGTQAFAAIGWNGTTELTGLAATWSVTGGVGNISSVGVFTASTAGSGSVGAAATYGGRSAVCSASVTVTTPPPTVAITSPSSGTSVTTATIVVRGTSTGATAVQARAGTGPWVNATGSLSTWSATLDVSTFPTAQPFPVEARAFNGTVESTHDRVTLFNVLVVIVTIGYPANHARVSGILTVTGTATSGSTVQVRFDSGPWRNVSAMGGTWTWVIDTTATFDGDHFLEAQAVLGSAASSIVSRDVVVSNPKPPWSILSPPLLYGVALAVVLVPLVAVLGVLARRRRKRQAASSGVLPRTPTRRRNEDCRMRIGFR